MIKNHLSPLHKIDHVIVTHDLPSLWNANIKGFEFISTDKLLTKVDSKMMGYVGADISLDSIESYFICLLLLFSIGELGTLIWLKNSRLF